MLGNHVIRGMSVENNPVSREARSVTAFVFVLFIAFLLTLQFLAGNATLQDPDSYWHIAIGQSIWHTGSVPRVDEWSHTFQGHPWIANSWFCDLLLFGAYSVGGWRTLLPLLCYTLFCRANCD